MGYARTVKAATAAAAAVLVAFGVRMAAPAAAGFVADELPRAQAAAATWLTPPYLYLVINAIILSIAASSRFQPNRPQAASAAAAAAAADDASLVRPAPAPVPVPLPVVAVPAPVVTMAMEMEVPVVPVPEAMAPEPIPVEVTVPEVVEAEEESFTISRSTWTPRRRSTTEAEAENEALSPFADLTNSREKPLVSTRFGRKPVKASPEGSRALGVSRPRKEQTLESTWKAITEGRAPPLARHLKKSDTWETRPGRRPSGGGEDAPPPATAMRKAETFNEAAGGGKKVRREPSLGQDELNRRVEAFINKFNMEMRLQRQESLKHYNEMISRGSVY